MYHMLASIHSCRLVYRVPILAFHTLWHVSTFVKRSSLFEKSLNLPLTGRARENGEVPSKRRESRDSPAGQDRRQSG